MENPFFYLFFYSISSPLTQHSSSTMAWLQETHFKYKDTNRVKRKSGKRYTLLIVVKRKWGVATLISNNEDFREKKVTTN